MRNSVFHNGNIFGIIGTDRRCEYDEIDIRCNVFFLLSDDDANAVSGERVSERALRAVGAGDGKAPALKNPCQTAHGNSADPRKIDVDRGVEIELHHRPSFIMCYVYIWIKSYIK